MQPYALVAAQENHNILLPNFFGVESDLSTTNVKSDVGKVRASVTAPNFVKSRKDCKEPAVMYGPGRVVSKRPHPAARRAFACRGLEPRNAASIHAKAAARPPALSNTLSFQRDAQIGGDKVSA